MTLVGTRNTGALVILLLSVVLTLPAYARKPDLILSTWCSAPVTRPDRTGYLDRILIEAFKRNGLQIEITEVPPERSLQQANTGKTDGDFLRVSEIGGLYPNLLMVPESLFDMKFVAFSSGEEVAIDGWKSLEPYRVGIVIGWKILEANVDKTRGRRSDIPDPDNMFRMLAAKRLDLAIYSEQFGLEIINRLGLKGIRRLTPPLEEKKMYLFLNSKHKKLIPKLDQTLKMMKRDGTFAAVARETLRDTTLAY